MKKKTRCGSTILGFLKRNLSNYWRCSKLYTSSRVVSFIQARLNLRDLVSTLVTFEVYDVWNNRTNSLPIVIIILIPQISSPTWAEKSLLKRVCLNELSHSEL
jgi:hypothetical protein